MNPRYVLFVDEYLRSGDAAGAAVAAGYAPSRAERRGKELLANPEVQRLRREREQALFDQLGVTPAWIGRRLVEIVDRCMQAVPHLSRNPETRQREPDGTWEFDPAGAIRALHELDEYMQGIRQDDGETRETADGFEEWLAKQTRESGL